MTDANDNLRNAESLDEQLEHAAEELITGDSDDPPLGEEAVVEILDKRFPQVRQDRPAPFTYRVRFDAAGKVVAKGWVRE